MTQECHGVWQLAIDLPVGRSYAFRYLVDGRWLTDHQDDDVVSNPFDRQNSVVNLEVELPT